MRYISTRGEAPALSFADCLLAGLARDGGLYLPETWPQLTQAEIAAYAGSDVVCYLADHPTPLVERQAREWGPWRDWAAREMGVVLEPVEGIVHRQQSPDAIAKVKAHALSLDDFRLTGLATAVPLLGSAVLALAVEQGALDGGAAFDLSRIDEGAPRRAAGAEPGCREQGGKREEAVACAKASRIGCTPARLSLSEAGLTTRRELTSSTCSTATSLLAFSVLPVLTRSTMASARPTSGANSIEPYSLIRSTCTPLAAKCSRADSTYLVATRRRAPCLTAAW